MDQKQKKIGQLRALLGQANTKLKNLKTALTEKDKQIQQVKMDYQKKLRSVQSEEGQIMKQYEERLIRIQKSLEDSENGVAKYKKLHQQSNKNYETVMNEITNIANLVSKNFSPFMSKDHNEAVEQLCTIEKCKDFDERLHKMQTQVPLLSQLIKGIRKLSGYYVQSLGKKRQLRLLHLRRQSSYQKQLQQQQTRHASSNSQIQKLNQEIKNIQEKYEKKIQTIAKSKAKISEEKTNIEFIKQLFIKVLSGPKQASLMAFQVLSKVLKFTPEQYKNTQKKIK